MGAAHAQSRTNLHIFHVKQSAKTTHNKSYFYTTSLHSVQEKLRKLRTLKTIGTLHRLSQIYPKKKKGKKDHHNQRTKLKNTPLNIVRQQYER